MKLDEDNRLRDWLDPMAGIVGALILVVALMAGSVIYHQTIAQLDSIVRARLANMAALAADLTDGAGHSTLTRPDQESSDLYARLQAPFIKVLKANDDLIYVYTVVPCQSKACIVLDAEVPRPNETVTHSSLMQVYEKPSPTFLAAMASHRAIVEPKPYTDEYGTFLSAYAPIYGPGKQFQGLVGVDMSYRQYKLKVAKIRGALLFGLGLSAIFALFVTAIISLLRRRNKKLQRQYRSIITNISAVIFEGQIDDRLSMSFINDYITTLTGYQAADIINNRSVSFASLIPEEDQEAVRAGIVAQLQSTDRFEIECRLRPITKVGVPARYVWVKISGVRKGYTKNAVPIVEGYMQNVTLRRATEAKAAESEKQFRTLADSMPNLLWITNLYGDTLFYNRTWLDFTGRTMDEDIDDGWMSRIHPDDKGSCLSKFIEALAEEKAFQCWFRLQRFDGEYRWMLSDCTPRFTASGKCDGYISAATDITERKAFEGQIKRANAQMELFIRHTPAAIAVLDKDMRYLMTSERWRQDYGLGDSGARVALSHADIFCDVPRAWKSLFERCLAGEIIVNPEVSFERKDGSIEWIMFELHPWYEDGVVGGMIMFTEVITERKRLDDELRHHRDHLQAMVDAQTQRMRLESDKNILLRNIITAANEAQDLQFALEGCLEEICVFTGWKLGHCYFTDDDGTHLISSMAWSRSARPFYSDLVTWVDAFALPLTAVKSVPVAVANSGKTVWLDYRTEQSPSPRTPIIQKSGLDGVVAFPIKVEKRLIGVFEFFAQDIIAPDEDMAALLVNIGLQIGRVIERFRQEDHLRQAKTEAEDSVKAKSEFLSNMSHELRTPMHAILNYAGMGLKRLTPEMHESDKLGKYLGNIQIAGNRLLGLLNNLLDLAKMESGKMTFTPERHDLKAVIDHTKMELDSLLRAKSLSLDVHYLTDATEAVFDNQRLIQVMVNLFSNAIKFTPEGSTLHLEVSEAKAGLLFSLKDEGLGVPPGELKHIFETFIQSSDTKSGAGGTGLGLSICKQIIEAHGGQIWAENAAEGGAKFCFILPTETPARPLLLAGE